MFLRHLNSAGFQVVILVLCCFLEQLASAQEQQAKPVIAVVTTPRGSGRQAAIARSIAPAADSFAVLKTLPLTMPSGRAFSLKLESECNASTALKEQARAAALAFDLVKAALLWREAADRLLSSAAQLYRPSFVASYLLEAAAASVEADQQDLALNYFRKALAVDSDIEVGAAFSPEAKDAFIRARRLGPAEIAMPKEEVLREMIRALHLSGVLWIAVSADADRDMVTEKLVLLTEESFEPETRLALPSAPQALDTWMIAERTRLKNQLNLRMGVETPKRKSRYRKWWAYVAAGGVIAAGIASAAAIAHAQAPSTADIVVHH